MGSPIIVCKWWQGQKRVVGPWTDVTFRGWEHCPQAGELLPRILKEAHVKVDILAGSGLSLAAFPVDGRTGWSCSLEVSVASCSLQSELLKPSCSIP